MKKLLAGNCTQPRLIGLAFVAGLISVIGSAQAENRFGDGVGGAMGGDGSFGQGSVTVHHNMMPEEREGVTKEIDTKLAQLRTSMQQELNELMSDLEEKMPFKTYERSQSSRLCMIRDNLASGWGCVKNSRIEPPLTCDHPDHLLVSQEHKLSIRDSNGSYSFTVTQQPSRSLILNRFGGKGVTLRGEQQSKITCLDFSV